MKQIKGLIMTIVAYAIMVLLIVGTVCMLFITRENTEIPPLTDKEVAIIKVKSPSTKKLAKSLQRIETEKIVKRTFPDSKKMMEIIRRESDFDNDAINYNCYYWAHGKRHSRSCKKGDEHLAWSVDCGSYQLNYKGKICPEESRDIRKATALAKSKFDDFYKRKGCGFLAWSSYHKYNI